MFVILWHSMTISVINAILSAIDASIIAYEVLRFHEFLRRKESFFLGLIGAALIMTIAPVLSNGGLPYASAHGTPYNLWPTILLRVAIGGFLIERMRRHTRHERENAAAMIAARYHFTQKKTR